MSEPDAVSGTTDESWWTWSDTAALVFVAWPIAIAVLLFLVFVFDNWRDDFRIFLITRNRKYYRK